MADEYLYESSISNPKQEYPFLSKEMLYLQDEQAGSYSSQITFNSTSLSNNGKYMDFKNSFLVIPYQITASGALIGAMLKPYSFGMKMGGGLQVIDSMSVDFGNKNVVNLTSFLNIFSAYKVLSSWSHNDLIKWGDQLLCHPDSASSAVYQAADSVNGIATCNNIVGIQGSSATAAVVRLWTAATPIDNINEGFLKRLKCTSYQPLVNGGFVAMSVAEAQALGKSSYLTATNLATWNMLLTVRLKDICDFFNHLPLLQGAQMRLTINFNASTTTLQFTSGPPPTIATSSSNVMNAGRTVPIMMASADYGQPNEACTTLATATIACNVLRTAAGASWGSMSSCRWYVPAYILSPEAIIRYRANEIYDVEYDDIYYYPISSISANSNFNQIISNGIENPQYMVCVPFYNNTDTTVIPAAYPYSPYQSIFDSCPGTTSPFCGLQQFNILVQGSNLFNQNEQYDFDQYCNEQSEINSLNGGKSTGLTSGLISQNMWSNNFRYYVGNLSRRVNKNEIVSLAVQGISPNCKIDLLTFTVLRKHLAINLLTGNPILE